MRNSRERLSTLITGASGSIGHEIAKKFSAMGHVIITGRDATKLEWTRTACEDPADISVVIGDLFNVRKKLVALADLYNIHTLILSSGQYEGSDPMDLVTTNLVAPIYLVKEILPLFLWRRSGSIIHINSLAGRNASPGEALYSASKHGMAGFLKAIRLESRKDGIRVLDVFLGATKSHMTTSRQDNQFLMEPSDVADAIFAAVSNYQSLYLEELTIGRRNFPK